MKITQKLWHLPIKAAVCREERSRPHQGIRIMRLQEQEQDLHAEAASWKLLAALHGNQDLTYPGGLAGVGLQGCGKAMPTKQLAAFLIASELDLNRCLLLVAFPTTRHGCLMNLAGSFWLS